MKAWLLTEQITASKTDLEGISAQTFTHDVDAFGDALKFQHLRME